MYRILNIIKGTTVDGPGFRTAIYFAGCRHQCPGCHNPQSWDFNGGTEMSLQELMSIIEEEDFDVTLTGGDPLYNPAEIAILARKIKESGHKVWLYTGFTIEEIIASPSLSLPLPYIDTIVDGPFIESLRDTDLHFRGSSNQRIIPNNQFNSLINKGPRL
ncbi:MAG: anaerobic ribonucleoside-triphosphate reductase activating protein [Muribaculaceae bacterium]|nr:anaerobic ribonucleoside-triphosphate reductase activating protein [Muribaculaceae bacterium]